MLSSCCTAQQSLTAEQINRLSDAGKLYGYVKYFHPFLQYKNINWDSAFAANVEGIINSTNANEYANALQKILSVLDDGTTRIARIPGTDDNYTAKELSYQVKDSILYVQMNDAPIPSTAYNGKFNEIISKLDKAKGAVFDLRQPRDSKYFMNMLPNKVYFDWWASSLFKGVINMPSERTMSYTDFPEEDYQGSTHAVFQEAAVSSVTGNLNKEAPFVFIASNEREVPSIAVKLQEQGKARILQQGERNLVPGSSIYFYISDSLLVEMRISESINTDGALMVVHPDARFKTDESDDTIYAVAERMLNSLNVKVQQQTSHPMIIEHLFPFANDSSFPSVGYRMLAVAKMFSIVNHFYSNRSSMHNNLETAYKVSIPKFIGAKDSIDYWKAVSEFHATIQDSHGFVSKNGDGFSLQLNPIVQDKGNFEPPVFTRMIENRIIVFDELNDSICNKINLHRGDIILSIDGVDPIQMIEATRKYQNAGNRESQNFYLSSFILFGHKNEIKKIRVLDTQGKIKEVMMPVYKEFKGAWSGDEYVSGMFSQRHKSVLVKLTGDIGYADYTSSGWDHLSFDSLITIIQKYKGFIIDMRGYPHADDNNTIISTLIEYVNKKSKATIYKRELRQNYIDVPASFPKVNEISPYWLQHDNPDKKAYYNNWIDVKEKLPIRFVVLTNGSAQSSAEWVVSNLKSNCNTTIIGSPTAGANAVFANYFIPGGIRLWLSNTSIERRGIQPDILVYPTVKGFQAGKDEVLERAIKYLQTGK
jgi:hypothetical protein